MKKSACLVIGALLAASTAHAGESPAFATDGYWHCSSAHSEPTIYTTAVFDGNGQLQDVGNAFAQALESKYGYSSQVSCSVAQRLWEGKTLATHQAERKREADLLRKSGKKVVETGWSYSPATARFSYFCFGGATVIQGGQRTNRYLYADPVDIAPSDVNALNAAWTEHLETLRPDWYFPAQGCTMLTAAQPAAMIQNYMDDWKAKNAVIDKIAFAYAPAVATATASPAAPAAASAFYQCWMAALGAYYITDGFESAKDLGAVNADWRAYITAEQPPQGFAQIRCGSLPSDPEQRRTTLIQNFATAGSTAVRVDWAD